MVKPVELQVENRVHPGALSLSIVEGIQGEKIFAEVEGVVQRERQAF